jgi:thymidine kinase
VVSRDGHRVKAITVKTSYDIINYIKKNKKNCHVVAIDEAQFFDNNLPDVCQYLADHKYNVYVVGLDTDFRGEPFAPMLKVMAFAEKIIKLNAICSVCGAPATRTQRIINNKPANYQDDIIQVGDNESYEARCRAHHIVIDKPKINSK